MKRKCEKIIFIAKTEGGEGKGRDLWQGCSSLLEVLRGLLNNAILLLLLLVVLIRAGNYLLSPGYERLVNVAVI